MTGKFFQTTGRLALAGNIARGLAVQLESACPRRNILREAIDHLCSLQGCLRLFRDPLGVENAFPETQNRRHMGSQAYPSQERMVAQPAPTDTLGQHVASTLFSWATQSHQKDLFETAVVLLFRHGLQVSIRMFRASLLHLSGPAVRLEELPKPTLRCAGLYVPV